MPTFINVYRELARRLRPGEHVTGTATTSTAATTLYDTTNLKYSSGDANEYDRKYVYAEITTAGADAGERGFSRVTEAGLAPSTGVLTLSPGITSFAADDTYIITDEPPQALKDAINAVLRNMEPPTFFPLSLHIMGNDANDMEPSTIATDYSSTNGTRATETTIVHNGAQSLKLTATATGGYANTGSIGIPESKSLYAAIMCYVTSGDSATFRVVDVTDSNATIEDATTDEPSWMELTYQFNTPADCEQIDFRFISDASGDIAYWDDFQVWHSGWGVYSCPSWITSESQVKGVQGFPQGTTGPSSDNDYRADERESVPLEWYFERGDQRADVPVRLRVYGTSYRPFIHAHRPLAEITTDTVSTSADLDKVVHWAAKYLTVEPENRAEVLGTIRALYLSRVTTTFPRRTG